MKRIPALVAASALLLVVACAGSEGDPGRVDAAPDAGLTPVEGQVVSAGEGHTCALDSSGAAWCWGSNQGGSLGDGTTIPWMSPRAVAMPAGVTFATLDAAGGATCALDAEGGPWCWGMLGPEDDFRSTADDAALVPTPVPVPEGTAFVDVDTGWEAACALTSEGAAWCWGEEVESGEARPPAPIAMPEGVRFSSIAVGGMEVCAVALDGGVWCWESPAIAFGPDDLLPRQESLPDGTTMERVAAATTSYDPRFCALDQVGAVWCWEDGPSASDVRSAPIDATFTDLSLSEQFACGVQTDGSAWCWFNSEPAAPGRAAVYIGAGGAPATTEPQRVAMPTGMTVSQVSVGSSHACVLATDGSAWCWGASAGYVNDVGLLGDGTPRSSDTPVAVLPFGTDAIAAPGYLEPIHIPWTGDLPLWSLSIDVSIGLLPEVVGGMESSSAADEIPQGCFALGDQPSLSPDECIGQALRDRGVSDAAVRLYLDEGISILSIDGTGPIRVLEVADWGGYGTTGGWSHPWLATPDGLLSREGWIFWVPWRDALSDANATSLVAEWNDVSDGDWGFEPIRDLGLPTRTDAGWEVPVAVCLSPNYWCDRSGFVGRFVFEVDAEGHLSGARFLDICWNADAHDRMVETDQLTEAQITASAALEAGLPACGGMTR